LAKSGSRLGEHHAAILAALLTQLVATLVGIIVLYSCARESPHLANPFREAVYLGLLGPPGLTLVIVPVNILGLGFLCALFLIGLRRPKARFLWYVAILLWGAWWVLTTYIMCAMADD
jgi:hypothetical protein